MNLNGKVAVIAGATGGLGQVVTTHLAEAGMKLVLLGRDEGRLTKLLDELGLDPDDHLTAAIDLTRSEGLADVTDRVQEKFGRADLLINLVGGWTGGKTVEEVEAEAVQTMIDQHLWSTFHLSRAFVPLMAVNNWGRVVVVSSPTANDPRAKSAPYAVGKAAQEALMLTLSKELAGSGVTANIIQVSSIDVDGRRDKDPEKYAAWTTPDEIVAAIKYLCSKAGGRMNGARLPLYGNR
jgi:NAD(P)-dependent dehydrogenase (short-subunit alcohol dehydrogenase family)